MERLTWEQEIADQRPLLKLVPEIFLQRLREREKRWFRRSRFRPNRAPSPQFFYTDQPRPMAFLLWEDKVQIICAQISSDVHLYLADNFPGVSREYIQAEGPEQILLRLYQISTRDPPEEWKTPPLFVQQSQGSTLL